VGPREKQVLMVIQDDMKLLVGVSETINGAVEKWLADRPNEISPSEETILGVVAENSGLSLPVRSDLLHFETHLESDEQCNQAQLLAETLLMRYCAYIQVVPSRGALDS
jgi:hypothetical protein